MSVVDVGVGKSRMASMYFGKGSMVSSDMWNPAKSTILRAKMEFLCIEDDSCLAYTDEKVNGSPPVRLQVGVIVDGVIHTTHLSLKVRYYRIEAAVVSVTRGKEALWRPRVSPSPERSDEVCEVTVRLTEGDAMISVPGITDCLPRAFRYSSRQVKWRFGWECLPFAMFIQRRQIHSFAGCAVVLPRYYHAVAPRHWLTVGDPFDDPEGLISPAPASV